MELNDFVGMTLLHTGHTVYLLFCDVRVENLSPVNKQACNSNDEIIFFHDGQCQVHLFRKAHGISNILNHS